MTYSKPELLVLNSASVAIATTGNGEKMQKNVPDANFDKTTTHAYEADE